MELIRLIIIIIIPFPSINFLNFITNRFLNEAIDKWNGRSLNQTMILMGLIAVLMIAIKVIIFFVIIIISCLENVMYDHLGTLLDYNSP